MPSWQHAGIFPAEFQIHTFVQIFLVIQCLWTGIMGCLCTYNPAFSACISETGVFKRISWTQPPTLRAKTTVHQINEGSDEEFVHPNVRASWSVRGGSMTLVQAGALFFGTRETYIVAMAAIIWREVYDTIDIFRYKKDAYKILFRFWWSPIGPMPPLASFNVFNGLAMFAILVAED